MNLAFDSIIKLLGIYTFIFKQRKKKDGYHSIVRTKVCKVSKCQAVIKDLSQFQSTHKWNAVQLWKAREATELIMKIPPKYNVKYNWEIFYAFMYKSLLEIYIRLLPENWDRRAKICFSCYNFFSVWNFLPIHKSLFELKIKKKLNEKSGDFL